MISQAQGIVAEETSQLTLEERARQVETVIVAIFGCPKSSVEGDTTKVLHQRKHRISWTSASAILYAPTFASGVLFVVG